MATIVAGIIPFTAALIDSHGDRVNALTMDLDELFPGKPLDPLTQLGKQDLDPLSLDELDERVAALKAEVARTEAHKANAAAFRANADSLFAKR